MKVKGDESCKPDFFNLFWQIYWLVALTAAPSAPFDVGCTEHSEEAGWIVHNLLIVMMMIMIMMLIMTMMTMSVMVVVMTLLMVLITLGVLSTEKRVREYTICPQAFRPDPRLEIECYYVGT